MPRKTYRDGFRVQEGDLGCVEVDVAIGPSIVECRSHDIWEIGWHPHRCHVACFAIFCIVLVGRLH